MEASAFCKIAFYAFLCVRAFGMKSVDTEDVRAVRLEII